MELKQLMYFKTVAECENITNAAERLFVSQPGLSKSIARLEDELGAELFDRNGKRLGLNEAGKVVLNYTYQLEQLLEHMRADVSALEKKPADLYLFTNLEIFWNYVLPQYQCNHPQSDLHCSFRNSEDLTAELLQQKSCNVILSRNELSGKNVICSLLYADQIMAIVPAEHPLAEKTVLYPQDLEGYSFSVGNPNHWNNIHLQDALRSEGVHVTFHPRYNVNYLLSQADQIQDLMIGNRSFAYFESLPGKRFIPIEGEAYKDLYYISYLKSNELRLEPFIHYLKEIIAEIENHR